MILFAIFVVILGPVCEELAFRGFLMPLLMRSFGPAIGIVLTGVCSGACTDQNTLVLATLLLISAGRNGIRLGALPDRLHRSRRVHAFHLQLDAVRGVSRAKSEQYD